MLATYYCQVIGEMKKDVHEKTCEIEELYKTVNRYEKNILACLKYLISLQ